MDKINEYAKSFKEGLNFVLDYADEEDPLSTINLDEPMIDYSSLSSIGYHDGFIQGTYYVRTYQTNSISSEQLSIIIDKLYGKALEKQVAYNNKMELFNKYKSGFVDGKNDVLTKYYKHDDSYNLIPEMDVNDVHSIGYYDGYCYFLREILKVDSLFEDIDIMELDKICKESFDKIYLTHNLENNNDIKKTK